MRTRMTNEASDKGGPKRMREEESKYGYIGWAVQLICRYLCTNMTTDPYYDQ